MVVRGLGTVLKKGTATPVTIGGLTEISGLQLTADTIDVTTLDSDGGYREFVGGFKDAGEVSVSGYFDPTTGNGQKELYDAFLSGAVEDYTIEFPAALKAKWAFKAVVTAFSTSVGINDPVNFEATLKVSGAPTLTVTA